MSYRLAADVLVWLHPGFILFVLFGGPLSLRRLRLAWLHLSAVAWGCAVESLGLPCPLTPLENRLRRAVGDAGHSGDFAEHYLLPLIYSTGLASVVQWILGAIALLVNLTAYLYSRHRRNSRWATDATSFRIWIVLRRQRGES